MYYSYDIQESEDIIEAVSVSDQTIDIYEDQDQDEQQTHSYYTPDHSISSKLESEDEDDDVIDQNRIFNLAEVKIFLDEVICPICCHIIKSPKICKECDQSFCGKCIDKWLQQSPNQQCPCCRLSLNQKNNHQYNQSIMDDKVPKVLLKLLSKLFLTCKYQQDGCEEIVTYDFREKHENQYCQYQEQVCENIGCYETMFRKDFEDHQLECKYAQVQCKYCQTDKLRMDIELHLQECDCRPILCEWCKQKQQAIDFDDHVEQCEFKVIICQHCQKKYKRYDMKYHTEIYCLNNLYQNSLELLQQKDHKILELQKQIELFKSNKLMIEQSDQNQSTNEISSEKYKQDFEEEVEEVIEEDIQIEESDSEKLQDLCDQDQDKQENNQNQQCFQYNQDDTNELIQFYNNIQHKLGIFINERLKEDDLMQEIDKFNQSLNYLK